MAIGTGFWWVSPIVGAAVAGILFVADITTPAERQDEDKEQAAEGAAGKTASSQSG